ncbi:MAG: ExbD/TolR family protein, partial [Stenotrophobium sp.]
MKSPRKVRRIERQHSQSGRDVPINIVSMIDVFAILVFYLMASIAAVEMRPNNKTLQLPRSSALDHPHVATQLQITTKDI